MFLGNPSNADELLIVQYRPPRMILASISSEKQAHDTESYMTSLFTRP